VECFALLVVMLQLSDVARGTLLKNAKNGSILKDVLRSSTFLGANGFFLMFWFCNVR